MSKRLFCLLPILLVLSAPATADPEPTAAQGRLLGRALAEGEVGEWANADRIAGRIGSDAGEAVVRWARLRSGIGTWEDYRDFLSQHPEWPDLETVRAKAEAMMPEDLSGPKVVAFFRDEAPRTGTGTLRLADALADAGLEAEADAAIVRGWREAWINLSEQAAILARYGAALAPHHLARLDRLLWQGRSSEVHNMLPLVDPDWQALARARLAIRNDLDGSSLLIRAVPLGLRDDPGLAYERYLYRVSKGRWDDAEQYLLEKSVSAAALGDPDLWMPRRANLARQALRRGDVEPAYRLAANNFGTAGAAFADAEWLAGYIALTDLDDPERAVQHFLRFRDAVSSPISRGRAGYWLGRAYERAGDPGAALAAYSFGAEYQTSFYGQLAAERSGVAADVMLAVRDDPVQLRARPILASAVVQAARLLDLAGEKGLATRFLRQAATGRAAADRAALAELAVELGKPQLGIRIAKDAALEGVVMPSQYYPLHAIADQVWSVPTEFALAVARQESEMNPAAASPAGARGLMQLMPGTAELMAGVVGVPYSPVRLLRDPIYNAQLGTAYLARMLERYDGSYLLATAAYNAGPGRVNQWLLANGDPRRPDVDAVDWIENIPFSETRDYVQRVLEALHVYRARLAGEAVPLRLAADLSRSEQRVTRSAKDAAMDVPAPSLSPLSRGRIGQTEPRPLARP
jgi:soluble lytic murein transglycosylase